MQVSIISSSHERCCLRPFKFGVSLNLFAALFEAYLALFFICRLGG